MGADGGGGVRRDIIIVFEPVDDTSMTATIEYEGAHVEMMITGDMPLARRLLDTLRDPNLPLARWLQAVEECQRAHRDMDALRARLERETTLVACAECGRGVRPAYAVAGMCGECATAEIEALRSRRKIDYYATKR